MVEWLWTSAGGSTACAVDTPASLERHGDDLIPAERASTPPSADDSRLRFGLGFVPAGSSAIVMICVEFGDFRCSQRIGLYSHALTCTACRSRRSDGTIWGGYEGFTRFRSHRRRRTALNDGRTLAAPKFLARKCARLLTR